MTRREYREQLKDPRWIVRRCKRIILANGICEKCADTDKLNVHHLAYVEGRMAWEYSDDELQVLCRKCHKQEHGISNKSVRAKSERECNCFYRDVAKQAPIHAQYKRWREKDTVAMFFLLGLAAQWERACKQTWELYSLRIKESVWTNEHFYKVPKPFKWSDGTYPDPNGAYIDAVMRKFALNYEMKGGNGMQ